MNVRYYVSTNSLAEHEEHKKIMQYLNIAYAAKRRITKRGRLLYFVYSENATADQQREAHRLVSMIGTPGTNIPEWRRR